MRSNVHTAQHASLMPPVAPEQTLLSEEQPPKRNPRAELREWNSDSLPLTAAPNPKPAL